MQTVNLEQHSTAWHEFRKSHIGASDLAPILGISPWKTAYTLWLEKTGRGKEDEPSFAMQQGTFLESEARLKYSEITGYDVMPNILLSDEWDVALASLDGITMDKVIIVEIKCPGIKSFEIAESGIIPEYYMAQMQWQLWVSKAAKCDYFVYMNKNKFKLLEVFPDPAYQQSLVIAAKEFWLKVISDEAPELSEKDYLCIEDEGAKVYARRWKELKKRADEVKDQLDGLEKALLEYSDDGNCFFGDTGVRISRVNRKGNVDWDAVCKKWEITKEEAEKFRKKSIGYAKFTAA